MRVQHFFPDISKAKRELSWQPKFSLIDGLRDSYENDYLATGKDMVKIDFSVDQQIIDTVP